MEIKLAAPADYQAIVALANRCYIGNLSPEEQKGGFLSANFTGEQVAEMVADPGIIVAYYVIDILKG